MEVVRYIARVIVVFVGCATIIASGGPVQDPDLPPPDPISLEIRSQDPTCSCTNARGVYLRNSSDEDRMAWFRFVTENTLSGEETFGEDFRIVPASNGSQAGESFLSCSIEETGNLGCVLEHEYRLRRHVAVSVRSELSAFGLGAQIPSLETCRALCEVGDPGCLSLGPIFASISEPIGNLYAQAVNDQDRIIERREVLQTYGLSVEDDTCMRNDLILENEGQSFSNGASIDRGCTVNAFGRLQQFLGFSGLSEQSLSDVSVYIPPVFRGEVSESLLASGTGRIVLFPDNEFSPHFDFSGANGDALYTRYGGRAIGAYRVGDELIIQTSNGCIASPYE